MLNSTNSSSYDDKEEKENKTGMRQPLLDKNEEKNHKLEDCIKAKENNNFLDKNEENLDLCHVMGKIFRLAIFPIIGMIFHPAYSIFNSIALGRNEDGRLLASLGLGSLTVGIMLLSIGSCFNGSLDTLVSQTFGQKDLRLCMIYLNRQMYLAAMVFVPLAVLVYFCEYGFLAIGQDPFVAKQASIYVQIVIPGVFFATYGSCYSRFFAGCRYTMPDMWSKIFSTIVHVALCYYLVINQKMGMTGVAIASSFHFFCRFLVMYLFFRFTPRFYDHNVSFTDPECFRNLWTQFKFSVKCAFLGVWSWWAFDIFTLISSYMTIDDLAAQTVLRNIGLLTYMIPVGIAQAASIMVGNNIGAKNVKAGKIYAQMCVLTSVIWGVGTVFVLILLRDVVIRVFSDSKTVNAIIAQAFPIISIFVFFDCVQGVGQGIIRGLGKQARASNITIIGYWILGIPISLSTVFYLNWGIVGLWTGPTVAIVFNFIFYYLIIMKQDWHQIAKDAEARRNKEKQN
eukprot:403331703